MRRLSKAGSAGSIAGNLEGILDAMDTGILLLDGALRPRFANSRFFEVWDSQPDDRDGCDTFDGLLARGGTGRGKGAGIDDWAGFAAEHAAAVREGAIQAMPMRFPSGALILCGCAVPPDGGRVLAYTDITGVVQRAVDEAGDRFEAELRFRNETMDAHASDLAALAEAADESRRRVEVARQELEREIAERRELEVRLRELATTDGLTGALNRGALLNNGQTALDRTRESGAVHGLALLMIDVDHFKSINDRYGHPGGDAALRHLAAILHAELRGGDLLGRLGGEEFAVVLSHVSSDEAEAVAERLVAAVAGRSVLFEGRSIHMTVSIGLAMAGRREQSIDQVLLRADIALYRAKGSGRNRVVIDGRSEAA